MYFRCDLANCITLIFFIFVYGILTHLIHIAHFPTTYGVLLFGFKQVLWTWIPHIGTEYLLKKSPVPRAITKVEYKVCFGYNNLNSNYLQHIGLVKIYDTSKLDLTVRNLTPPPPKKRENKFHFMKHNA